MCVCVPILAKDLELLCLFMRPLQWYLLFTFSMKYVTAVLGTKIKLTVYYTYIDVPNLSRHAIMYEQTRIP